MSSSMKDGQKNCLRVKGVLRSSMLVVQPQPVASLALRAHSHSVTFVMNKTWLRGSVISSKTNCRLPQKQHKMLREMRNALERRNQSMTPRHHHQSLKVRRRAKPSPKQRVHQRTIHAALARRPSSSSYYQRDDWYSSSSSASGYRGYQRHSKGW